MKKFVVVIFLFAMCVQKDAVGQNEYFAGNPVWGMHIYCPPEFGGEFMVHYQATFDTIVNSDNYKAIESLDNGNILGLFRSSGKVIYWWNDWIQEDELWYDFSGGVGDTLDTHISIAGEESGEFLITAVDSVLISNEWRRVFSTIHEFCGSPVFVEGVGPLQGFFGTVCELNCASELDCFQWSGENYVVNFPSFTLSASVCEPIIAVEEQSQQRIEVFPNPVGDYLQFQGDLPQSFDYEVEISDATGRIFLRSRNQHQLEISSLANGIYFLKAEWESGQVVKKWVKE